MKTKTLLIAAATLAVGVISSQAQSNVYSANIVGYANVVINGGGAFTQIGNPLSGTTNTVASLINLQGGETVYIWQSSGTNVGYYAYQYLQGAQANGYGPSDWADGGGLTIPNSLGDPQGVGFNFVPEPLFPPGQPIYINEPNPTFTNTFVGTVLTSNTNSPTPINGGGAYTLLSSVVPVSGDLETNSATALPLQGGETVYIWQSSGTNVGYYAYQYLQGAQANGYGPSDWADGGGLTIPGSYGDPQGVGFNFVPPPQIQVGGAIYLNNPNAATFWTNSIVIQ